MNKLSSFYLILKPTQRSIWVKMYISFLLRMNQFQHRLIILNLMNVIVGIDLVILLRQSKPADENSRCTCILF